MALDFLTPYIEDALADPAGGFTVRLERTQLTWAGWEKALDLRAVGVHALVRDRGVVASVPEVAVTMSGRALLRAELAPSAIEIIGPRIRLFRDSGGEVHWGLGEGGPGEAAGVVDRLIAQLQGGVEGPIASLRRLEIVGGELVIEDAVLGFTWHAPDADIKLRRDADGISADLGVHIDFGDEKPRLRGVVRWDRFTGKLAGAATFGDVRPAAFAPALPELARLSAIDMPLAGSVAFAFHPASGIETLSLDLTGAGGALRVPEPLAATYPLETLHLKLAASDYFATLRVDEFFADLGAPRSRPAPWPTVSEPESRSRRMPPWPACRSTRSTASGHRRWRPMCVLGSWPTSRTAWFARRKRRFRRTSRSPARSRSEASPAASCPRG